MTFTSIYLRYHDLCDDDEEDDNDYIDESLALLVASEAMFDSKRSRRYWIHETIRKRDDLGEFHKLVQELESDDERFQKYFRMNKRQFDEILLLVEKDLSKEVTNYRRPICARERLAVTLR